MRLLKILGLVVLTFTAFANEPQPEPQEGVVVVLTWKDNADNENGFEIQRGYKDEPFVSIAKIGKNEETYTDVVPEEGIYYSYKVRAFNDMGNSGFTNIVKKAYLKKPTEIKTRAE